MFALLCGQLAVGPGLTLKILVPVGKGSRVIGVLERATLAFYPLVSFELFTISICSCITFVIKQFI